MFSERYHCDAVAEKPSRCVAFAKQDVLDALNNPDVARSILKAYSQEIRNLRSQLELRNIRRADDRVAAFLTTLPRDKRGWCGKNASKRSGAATGWSDQGVSLQSHVQMIP